MKNEGIVLCNVNKKIKDFNLENINIHIPIGNIGFLIGNNGAGKTTLLNMVSGNMDPDGGFVTRISKGDLGFVFDENHLPENLTLMDYKIIFKSLFQKWDEKEFLLHINQFKLPIKKEIKNFSRGMKIKFNLSVILSYYPKYLLLDEITSGLDPIVREEILIAIKKYVKKNNATAMVTTHILEDIMIIADQIVIIDEGCVKLNTHINYFKDTKQIKEKIQSFMQRN